MDIQRYLLKETTILEDVVNKANSRQKAENSRFYSQVGQIARICKELNEDRQACVDRVSKVQDALGIATDPLEGYKMPLGGHQQNKSI
jgi:urocanate hydratase